MLILNAIVGAITGYAYGFQALGVAIAVLPQVAMLFHRESMREDWHIVTHSFFFTALLALTAQEFIPAAMWCAVMAHLSHLFMDCISGDDERGPALFFPLSDKPYSYKAPFPVVMAGAFVWVNMVFLLTIK